MHKTLKRQITQVLGPNPTIPSEFQKLLDMISTTYLSFDDDRAFNEHSFEISSRELEQSEQALRSANAFQEAIIQSLPTIFYVINKEGHFIKWNKALEEVSGYSSPELYEIAVLDLFEGQDKESVGSKISEVFEKGSSSIEAQLISKNKIAVPFYLTGQKVATDQELLVGVGMNISKRKQFENELKQSQQRLQDIIMSSADWIWETNEKGEYSYVSGKVKHVLGYEPSELLGKAMFDLMPTSEASRVSKIFHQLVSEKKPIVELINTNLTKTGKEVIFITNGTPIFDDSRNIIGYRGIDKDITESTHTQKALQKEQTLAQKYLDIASVIIVALDKKGNILEINKKGCEVLNLSRDQLIGKNWFDEFIPESEKQSIIKTHQSVLAKNTTSQYNENYIQTPKGLRLYAWNNSAMTDVNNNIIGSISSGEDITDKKNIEQEKQKYIKDLEKLNNLMVGRELKMIELKQKLKQQL